MLRIFAAQIRKMRGQPDGAREPELNGDALYEAARDILADPARRASMSEGMAKLGIRDATERLYNTVMEICK